VRVFPAPHFLALDELAQQCRGLWLAQSAEGFDGFQPDVGRVHLLQLAAGNPQQ
jgi:hypothetical protein